MPDEDHRRAGSVRPRAYCVDTCDDVLDIKGRFFVRVSSNEGLSLAQEPSDLDIDDFRMSDWGHVAKTGEFDYSDAW
jgi:hypothetical protein